MLSPFHFILAIDWLMKETTKGRRNGIQWTPWTQLEDLDFADDLALLSHKHDQMQSKTSALNDLSLSVRLKIHPGKSKILKAGPVDQEQVKIGEQVLEKVGSFCYLGSIIDRNKRTEADVKSRIGKAQAAFSVFEKVWITRDISQKT